MGQSVLGWLRSQTSSKKTGSKLSDLKLVRLNDDGDSTIGIMKVGGRFQCYTLEDQASIIKIKGETRIPAGRYEIKHRRVLSGLTQTYRKRFPWFTWHLELQDVPNFTYVYIHAGNDDDDTDACILVGQTQMTNVGSRNGYIGSSAEAYEILYRKLEKMFAAGERVFIDIVDE